jgi:Cdc25 family phosphatase
MDGTPITISSLRYISRDELADRLLQQQRQQADQASAAPEPDAAATTAAAPPPGLAVVDVRDEDYVGGHVRGCVHAPSSSLDHAVPELARRLRDARTIVFHCALSQQRGPVAALRYARERARMGLGGGEEEVQQDIFVLDGGFVKWQEK